MTLVMRSDYDGDLQLVTKGFIVHEENFTIDDLSGGFLRDSSEDDKIHRVLEFNCENRLASMRVFTTLEEAKAFYLIFTSLM